MKSSEKIQLIRIVLIKRWLPQRLHHVRAVQTLKIASERSLVCIGCDRNFHIQCIRANEDAAYLDLNGTSLLERNVWVNSRYPRTNRSSGRSASSELLQLNLRHRKNTTKPLIAINTSLSHQQHGFRKREKMSPVFSSYRISNVDK